MAPNFKTFGEAVKARREKVGLDLDLLAEGVGVSPSELQALEAGKDHRLRETDAFWIAALLDEPDLLLRHGFQPNQMSAGLGAAVIRGSRSRFTDLGGRFKALSALDGPSRFAGCVRAMRGEKGIAPAQAEKICAAIKS